MSYWMCCKISAAISVPSYSSIVDINILNFITIVIKMLHVVKSDIVISHYDIKSTSEGEKAVKSVDIGGEFCFIHPLSLVKHITYDPYNIWQVMNGSKVIIDVRRYPERKPRRDCEGKQRWHTPCAFAILWIKTSWSSMSNVTWLLSVSEYLLSLSNQWPRRGPSRCVSDMKRPFNWTGSLSVSWGQLH